MNRRNLRAGGREREQQIFVDNYCENYTFYTHIIYTFKRKNHLFMLQGYLQVLNL